MKRLISITVFLCALAVLAIAQDKMKVPLATPPGVVVASKDLIIIPPERVKELQVLVDAASDARVRHEFAAAVFSDACPCVRNLVAGLKAEWDLKSEQLTTAILTERILRDVPKEFVLNEKWAFVPPPPAPKKQ